MNATKAFAAHHAHDALTPFSFDRREPGPHDVVIEISHCGVCHTDWHFVNNDFGMSLYPMVPGHEIVGTVSRVGNAVRRFAVGDGAGVGCLVDSCRECDSCNEGLEQHCQNGFTLTYSGLERDGKSVTQGGYSTSIVVDERFVLHVSEKQNLAAVAPLLCAGITMYSPLRHWKVEKGQKVGIVGLGGLGHMGIKLASALGAHVVLFTTSPGKGADAKRLGASEVVISRNPDEMARHLTSFDFIIDTVSVSHDLDTFLRLLKRDGTLCLIGAPEHPHPSPTPTLLILKRRSLAGSLIGGIKETQEMLDFCAQHGIVSDIELIPMPQIDQAYERMLRGDVKYRFVIDLASL